MCVCVLHIILLFRPSITSGTASVRALLMPHGSELCGYKLGDKVMHDAQLATCGQQTRQNVQAGTPDYLHLNEYLVLEPSHGRVAAERP